MYWKGSTTFRPILSNIVSYIALWLYVTDDKLVYIRLGELYAARILFNLS